MTHKKLVKIAAVFTALALSSTSAMATEETDTKDMDISCVQRAEWIDPQGLKQLDKTKLMKQGAAAKVVLLGEQHPDAVHHRWQLQTLTQLYAHNPNMVIGFEMFPRRVQPVLDAWARGELNEEEFLEKSDWDDVWKYDADNYMPIFRFARMNKLPILALNVNQELISEVSRNGWENVEDAQKEGVETPRDALPGYVDMLEKVFSKHTHKNEDEKTKERINRFIQAQLTWDGAMAQKIAEVQKMGGDPLVVGIMGSGHLENRYGVPHQLEGLGLKSKVLLPWTVGWDCDELTPTYADAVFGLEEMEEEGPKENAFKPLLGVRIATSEDPAGVMVEQVIEESVAEDAGIEDGDIIIRAASFDTVSPADLIEIIQRQAPGTWLPLRINRNDREIDILAKFPNGVETP